eukprot:gene23079-29272_t
MFSASRSLLLDPNQTRHTERCSTERATLFKPNQTRHTERRTIESSTLSPINTFYTERRTIESSTLFSPVNTPHRATQHRELDSLQSKQDAPYRATQHRELDSQPSQHSPHIAKHHREPDAHQAKQNTSPQTPHRANHQVKAAGQQSLQQQQVPARTSSTRPRHCTATQQVPRNQRSSESDRSSDSDCSDGTDSSSELHRNHVKLHCIARVAKMYLRVVNSLPHLGSRSRYKRVASEFSKLSVQGLEDIRRAEFPCIGCHQDYHTEDIVNIIVSLVDGTIRHQQRDFALEDDRHHVIIDMSEMHFPDQLNHMTEFRRSMYWEEEIKLTPEDISHEPIDHASQPSDNNHNKEQAGMLKRYPWLARTKPDDMIGNPRPEMGRYHHRYDDERTIRGTRGVKVGDLVPRIPDVNLYSRREQNECSLTDLGITAYDGQSDPVDFITQVLNKTREHHVHAAAIHEALTSPASYTTDAQSDLKELFRTQSIGFSRAYNSIKRLELNPPNLLGLRKLFLRLRALAQLLQADGARLRGHHDYFRTQISLREVSFDGMSDIEKIERFVQILDEIVDMAQHSGLYETTQVTHNHTTANSDHNYQHSEDETEASRDESEENDQDDYSQEDDDEQDEHTSRQYAKNATETRHNDTYNQYRDTSSDEEDNEYDHTTHLPHHGHSQQNAAYDNQNQNQWNRGEQWNYRNHHDSRDTQDHHNSHSHHSVYHGGGQYQQWAPTPSHPQRSYSE